MTFCSKPSEPMGKRGSGMTLSGMRFMVPSFVGGTTQSCRYVRLDDSHGLGRKLERRAVCCMGPELRARRQGGIGSGAWRGGVGATRAVQRQTIDRDPGRLEFGLELLEIEGQAAHVQPEVRCIVHHGIAFRYSKTRRVLCAPV